MIGGQLDGAHMLAGLAPIRWPVSAQRSGGRFFEAGGFYHPDGQARIVRASHRAPATQTSPAYPFRLNTGRLRDQWHTMTRTALSPRLSAHLPEPFIDIHPMDAAKLGLGRADLVRVTSPSGKAILRARLSDTVQPGDVFASMHWTGETAPAARIDALVAALTDPTSGQPESKASPVALARFNADWYGFAVARAAMDFDCDYWAQARTAQGYRAELAGTGEITDWEVEARRLFAAPDARALTIMDAARGAARVLLHEGGVVTGALFVASEPVAVMRDYFATVPGTDAIAAISGRPVGGRPDPGPVLCSCFGVGVNTIIRAVEDGTALSVEAIGAALGAGTNCGSCRPEIAALLDTLTPREAAE